jgi:cytochrome c-type biogenesis protein CcmH/NrfG
VNDLLTARRLSSAKSFVINLGLGVALLQSGRYQDAYSQIKAAENLITTDREQQAFHYWRARAANTLGDNEQAIADWLALVEMADQGMPRSWVLEAKNNLKIATQTAVSTLTGTPTTGTPEMKQTNRSVLITKTATP